MKSTRIKSLGMIVVAFGVYVLFLTGLPFATTAQSKSESVTLGPGVNITESVVFPNQPWRSFLSKGELNPNIKETQKAKAPDMTAQLTQRDIAARGGVRIFTNRDAWYKVTPAELQSSGFNTAGDQDKWQLFCDGVEVPMYVGFDGSVEFFGKGADTLYTDSKVYYLVEGDVDGARIQQYDGGGAGQSPDSYNYDVKVERKDRQTYLTSLVNGDSENWFGSVLNSTATDHTLDLTNVDTNEIATLEVRIQGLTAVSHLVTVKINGFDIGVMSFSGKANYVQSFSLAGSQILEGTNVLSLQAIGGGADVNLLDSFSITHRRIYKAINNKLNFGVSGGQSARVEGFSESGVRVYEVTNGNVAEIDVQQETINGTFGFSMAASGTNREFFALTNTATSTPQKIEENTPSTLDDPQNGAEFVIVTPRFLAPQAQVLADRRNSQGILTMVVYTEDIADEFGFGILTAEALKSFLFKTRKGWYISAVNVLLFGDSSYDMRNYLGGEDRNIIPTKLIDILDMETASDPWIVDYDDDGLEDTGIGRLPVANPAEAARAVAKIVRYETELQNEPFSAMLAADYYFEILNGALEDLLPAGVASNRIERWTLGTVEMRNQVLAGANANPTVVTYLGHGTTGAWTNGGVLTLNDPPNMTNDKLSFYVLMTCLNGYSHNSTTQSLAESLLMADNGAIAVWASSGSTYASGQISMSQAVIRDVFPNGPKGLQIGEVVLTAKRTSNDMDARRSWQLLGDPTVKIR